jgi:hypothetical protein
VTPSSADVGPSWEIQQLTRTGETRIHLRDRA